MNHDESIAILLRAVAVQPKGGRPSAEERRQAEEHVARCSDCWEVLSLVYELATGEHTPEAEHMRVLYSCERIQDQLWLLEGLGAREVKEQFPEVVRHLGWCHACRDRLVEILHVAHAAARGEYGPPVIAPAAPQWKEIVGTVGEKIRALIGQVIVQIRQGADVFTSVPAGLIVSPVTADAMRGVDRKVEESKTPILGHRVSFPLADSGLSAELTLRANGSKRVCLEVQVTGAEEQEFSIQLRTTQKGQKQLLSSRTTRGTRLVAFKDLPTGEYQLEIRERARKLRFQIPFSTEVST